LAHLVASQILKAVGWDRGDLDAGTVKHPTGRIHGLQGPRVRGAIRLVCIAVLLFCGMVGVKRKERVGVGVII